ncbi:hypothetical protein B6N60_02502 [Richelia sinica FACHB-800]|uniref:Uncharacterized protein n=1 Tax=Richelia sinica FACHB-800 TaxID=1357546 RepID=A0A975T7S6_9NOST|nr:hypothetical protein [Richelia sinica]MBD2666459.1 hypothetical protein [Richelia sinica FACHB-800]QXE23811.1 hypothetical protein B6N60_02502 [Richelia sinica FACHB-800]
MARAIERIEQDITGLKEAIAHIAKELHNAYAGYLSVLGPTLQKQLILAAYHLCTQGYADKFLKLSLNQRQQLQQGIRKLGKKAAEELLVYLHGSGEEEEEQETEAMEEMEETLEIEEDEESENDQEIEEDIDSDINNSQTIDPGNPLELSEWQQDLEEAIQTTLKEVSHNTNVLIQKAGILPQKLPEQILAAAAAAASETAAEVIPGPPNILNLVIEVSSEKNSEDSSLTQIMTINLRLTELEFADTTLLSGRKQIRNILVQLNKLGREYQKKHRELKIAEAEAAWRASWFED